MSKELVISATAHETRVAILEDGHLCEIYIEREKEFALVGSIYKGRVTRVLPGMQSAFVDIGRDTDAFLYVSDFLENLEEYDHVPTEEERGQRHAPAGNGHARTHAAPGIAAAPAAVSSHEPAAPVSEHEPSGQPYEPAAAEEPSMQPDYAGEGAAPSAEASPAYETPAKGGEPAAQAEAPIPQPSSDVLPGETRVARDASDALPFRAPISSHHDRPRGDRGFGGGFGRGGGRDRGGRRGGSGGGGGGGRFRRSGPGGGGGGRGPRGDRDRRPSGRDLPPSKYASPHSSFPQRGHEGRSSEPPAAPTEGYEPILLPGESLAKYNERNAPRASGAIAQESSTENRAADSQTSSQSPESSGFTFEEETAPTFPGSTYAHPESREEGARESGESSDSDERFETTGQFIEAQAGEDQASEERNDERLTSEQEQSQSGQAAAESGDDEWIEFGAPGPAVSHEHHPDLTDEQARTLAESFAEAKQEETHEEADDEIANEIGGAEFVEENGAIAEAEEDAEESHEDAAEHHDEAAEIQAAAESESQPHEAADPQQPARPLDREPRSARMDDSRRARFQRPMRRGGRQRSGRPPMRHGHGRPQDRHAPQRRPQLISEMLKAGEEIIVQIAKEPLGKKGARITSHVALPGRFLVYMPTVNHIGVSRKINSAEMRSKLRSVVGEYRNTFPGGFIVRTAAGNVTEQDLRTDIEFLGKMWKDICGRSEERKAPALLHRDLNLVERILRDYVNSDYSSIWIDNEEEFSKVVEFVSRFQPDLANRVKLYTKEAPIFEEFGIQQELDKALRPKVWLKSGGYIVINHTEALVAIDVNTGKFVGRGSTRLEDTIVKTNLEAVKEIVRQIRLRDLGGIIVVDFIDMEERRNREKVMHALDDALRADKAPSKVLSFNEFGLVNITRKRTKQALEKVLCQPCPYCTGSGMVKSIPTICYEIQQEAKKMAGDLDSASVTLRVNPEIAKALKTREAPLVEELEANTRKSVIIQSDPTLHWEQYDIF
ncbi:MAG TPA: Rne/Rng family ribonuclease [Candidatus Acidoferrales bacterium]|jgi:ribonuclease G|nr:Rne/Rng family ribonuclease [Candidatus Acidoferrales bacterium]